MCLSLVYRLINLTAFYSYSCNCCTDSTLTTTEITIIILLYVYHIPIYSVQETSDTYDEIEGYMKSYVSWVLNVQSESDPNDIDIRTEPKFNLPHGDVFTEPWCRPQNDGPGLRATSLIIFANTLSNNNETDYIKSNLWTGNDNDKNGGAIKYDLDYIISNYATSTCDLWEEIRSTDFFWNRITMKKAMLMGAQFATSMGDSSSAALYTTTANTIESTLYNNHWTGSAIIEDNSRTYDGAVIVGLNNGYDSSDNLFFPTSIEVASTVNEYNNMFCNEYSINDQDQSNNIPGILYGRYQNDIYAGGNPWILTTAALANLFYRGASYIKLNGLPDSTTLDMWANVFNIESSSSITEDTFVAAGDSVLNRIKYHVQGKDFHLDEQLDRNTGVEISAEDLTWSYAEVLNAVQARDNYFNL